MARSRPNPEIPDILRCIEDGTRSLLEETDHTRRIGHARILMAHLQMLGEEPARIVEVEEIADDERRNGAPDAGAAGGAYPFDTPGETEGLFVQYAGGVLSPCSGPLDPFQTGPTHRSFVLWALEVRWVAETPTTHRIVDAQMVERARGRRTARDAPSWIFVDPAGRGAGVPAEAGRLKTLRGAIRRARELAEEWGVRTLVAQVRATFDGH